MAIINKLKENLPDILARGRETASASHHSVLVSLAQRCNEEFDALDVFLTSAARENTGAFWAKPERDFLMAGAGQAAVLTAGAENRFDSLRGQLRELTEPALVEAPPVHGVGPVFMGGFRFDTGAKRDKVWQDFPDALLVLPRFALTRSGSDAWITVNAMIGPDTDVRTLSVKLLEDLQLAVSCHPREDPQPAITRVVQTSREEWYSRVTTALNAITAGEVSKVVLSRRKVLYAGGRFSTGSALRKLWRQYPECVVFAFRNGDASFIGATPEELARVERGELSVACLASSTARGADAEDDIRLQARLFESRKERAEHNAVTVTVAGILEGLCDGLSRDTDPQPVKLKNIQHLLTCFSGRLKPGIDILNTLERLHPTPAVAGVPTDRSLDLIARLEDDRGWYAAPVGWLDGNGEGEFVVAIRSALLDNKRAFLHAGCGIVAGSDPEQEFRETELKFEPLFNALGGN